MTNVTPSFENIEQLPLATFTESAYRDYAMYVIMDRALPHIGDGLKPVQRRIVYAMSELGLKAAAKYKKSARTVGDVLGKYHPHGDTACYEAMVLMAQPFSYRYPLVDGQGNWGSTDDPKSFAAMRYTEAKLSKYADVLLSEVGAGTVEWVPNFDGTMKEPKLLPAQVPNLLLNGTTGIAVGMATDIPPHNLLEVVNATIHLMGNPKASLDDLLAHCPGPDLPTDAEIITPAEQLKALYETGTGSYKMRAVYQTDGADIVITALPYQVSGAKVLEQIAKQMQLKKLPQVVDLRDESDHENPTRLLVTLKSNRVDASLIMGHLFATTDLERSYRVNFNVIGIDGRPQVKPLVTFLSEWLTFRRDVVTSRLNHRLSQVVDRLHVLDGLLIAFLNLDEVIRIIREEDKPKAALMSAFGLTETQAEAILELKLRHLAKLEEMKIKSESDALAKEQAEIEAILGSTRRLNTLIRKELQGIADAYGDPRKSPLVERAETQAIDLSAQVNKEPITVILSQNGWIRSAKGHGVDGKTLNYKSGDEYLCQLHTHTTATLILLDDTGRTYAIAAHQLPSARGYGEPLSAKLQPPSGAKYVGLWSDEVSEILLMTDIGYGFKVLSQDCVSKNKRGKAVLKVSEGAQVLKPLVIESGIPVGLITCDGYFARINESEIPVMSKGKGSKLIGIPTAKRQSGESRVTHVLKIPSKKNLVIRSGQRNTRLKPRDLDGYFTDLGLRGSKLPKFAQKPKDVFIED